MIRPPSLQHEMDLIWSRDPALSCSSDPEGNKDAIRIARETGDWSALIIEGQQPTRFVVKPLGGTVLRKIVDEVTSGSMGPLEGYALAFRAAWQGIANFGGKFEMKFDTDPKYGKIASSKCSDIIDAIDPSIITELGSVVFERAQGIAPKS